MAGYSVSKEDKTVYVAKKRVDGNTIRYEFWQSENGWYIQCDQWAQESAIPIHSEMWVPDEVINQIITPDAAKKLLNE
jgi:hypothetical protein